MLDNVYWESLAEEIFFEDATAKTIGEERSYPRGHHIEWQDQSSVEGSPAGNQNPVVGKKMKSPNNKTPPNPKRTKETSAFEVRPLTMANISGIVAAVADANRREKPAQVSTGRCTLRIGNRTS